MKNKKNTNLDTSYEKFKNNFKKNNANYLEKKFHCKNNICENKMILNKSNFVNDSKSNNINKTFINYPRNKNNNSFSKDKLIKQKNTRFMKNCYTPDRNYKYNMGLTQNNNISLIKVNNRKCKKNIEHYANKNAPKFFLSKQNRKYNILSKDRNSLTPNKVKISYFENSKKIRESESSKYFYSDNKNYVTDFSKSCQESNYHFEKFNNDNYYLFDNSSFRCNKKKENYRTKTPDKFKRKLHFLNYKNNTNLSFKNSNFSKIHSLNKTSKIKFSNSYCGDNNRNQKNLGKHRKSNEKYIFSNSQINRNRRYFNEKNKIKFRAKSSDYKCERRKYYKSNNNQRKNFKNRNFNNSYFESSTNKYKNKNNKLIKNSFNNFNSSKKSNDFNYSTNYENYFVNKSEMSFSQKKANKDLGKFDYPHNYVNNISNTFNEKAKINNNKVISKKTYKFSGINNYVTKSSTNTYDEINSLNSNISKNTILDSIEEIHFNFVNVVQSSRNLVRIENKKGDKIIENNQNSSIILLEERDIE